jgi:hypothetical protein
MEASMRGDRFGASHIHLEGNMNKENAAAILTQIYFASMQNERDRLGERADNSKAYAAGSG